MNNNEAIQELMKEIELIIHGVIDAGFVEQYHRVIGCINNDFCFRFPNDMQFFALSVEQGMLKYYAFIDKASAEKAIKEFKNNGDATEYRIYPRVVAEMVGREYEFYQYLEEIAESDEDAAKFAVKQQEIIDFLFSCP